MNGEHGTAPTRRERWNRVCVGHWTVPTGALNASWFVWLVTLFHDVT